MPRDWSLIFILLIGAALFIGAMLFGAGMFVARPTAPTQLDRIEQKLDRIEKRLGDRP
jgi:hypothetical protein